MTMEVEEDKRSLKKESERWKMAKKSRTKTELEGKNKTKKTK